MERESSVRSLALVASMGALGNILGVIPIALGQIPTPGVSQVALDFSSVVVVVVAIFLGWKLGALTGLIAGIGPMVMFGYVLGSTGLITVLLPVGKAMTGLFVGGIAQTLGNARKLRAPFVFTAVLLGFIPEAILIWFYFQSIVPFFIATGRFWAPALALPVLVKAWGEMIIIGFITVTLIGNEGFRMFLRKFVPADSILIPTKKL